MNYRSGWKMTTESNALKPYWQNYVGGVWCDGGAGRITIDNPATGEAIAEHALADNHGVDRAIGAARNIVPCILELDGKSGYGRERGREALWNYVRTKNIAVAFGGSGGY